LLRVRYRKTAQLSRSSACTALLHVSTDTKIATGILILGTIWLPPLPPVGDRVDAEVGRGNGVKEGAQVDGALGPEHRLELLLRLGPFLYRLAEASCTGLGQPQRLAPAITAPRPLA
jgi:hypothetical protein